MNEDIVETIKNFKNQYKIEKWDLNEYCKYVIETLLHVYSNNVIE